MHLPLCGSVTLVCVGSRLISMFDCIRLKPSSPLTLSNDPLYQCNTSNPAFVPMLLFSIVGLCLAVAVPVYVYLFIRSLHKTGRINHPSVLLEFGTLYDIYSQKYGYWEAVIMSRKLLMLIILVAIQNASAQSFLTALLSAIYAVEVWKRKPFRVVWMEIGPYNIDFLNQMEFVCSLTVFVNYSLAFFSSFDSTISVAAGYLLLLSNILVILVIIFALLFRVYVTNADFVKQSDKLEVEANNEQDVELVLLKEKEGSEDSLVAVLDERYIALKKAYFDVLKQYSAGLQPETLALEQVETLRPVLFRTFAALHDYMVQQRDAAEAKSSSSHTEIVSFISSIEKAQASVVVVDNGELTSEVKKWEEAFAENTLIGMHQLFLKQDYDILFSCWSHHNTLIRSSRDLIHTCAKCSEFGLAFSIRNIVLEARSLPRKEGQSLLELMADEALMREYTTAALRTEYSLKELELQSKGGKSVDDR